MFFCLFVLTKCASFFSFLKKKSPAKIVSGIDFVALDFLQDSFVIHFFLFCSDQEGWASVSFRQETYHFPLILFNKVLQLIFMPVLSAEWKCATFPTEGSVYLRNKNSSKIWKTVLCKEQKGHQETISFNFASVVSTVGAILGVKII